MVDWLVDCCKAETALSCQFVSRDADTGRHSVILKTSDARDLSDLLSTDEGQEVEGRDVENEVKGEELQQTYPPAVVSPGKHKVSQTHDVNHIKLQPVFEMASVRQQSS